MKAQDPASSAANVQDPDPALPLLLHAGFMLLAGLAHRTLPAQAKKSHQPLYFVVDIVFTTIFCGFGIFARRFDRILQFFFCVNDWLIILS